MKKIVFIFVAVFAINIASAQQDSVNVNNILNRVLQEQKKKIEKKGKEEQRMKDSLQREMDTYLSQIEKEEKRASDSILFLETKMLITSVSIEKNKQIEILKDSISKIRMAILTEVPSWYQDYGVKAKILALMKIKVKGIEEQQITVNMTEESYPNEGNFFKIDSEKESILIAMNDELNQIKKEELKQEKKLKVLEREFQKQKTLFKNFKTQYDKLNPKLQKNEKEELNKNLQKYKYIVSSIKSLEQELKKNGRLSNSDPSVRRKIRNIFRKVDWEFKSPVGNNKTLIKSALEQAKTLASSTD